MNICCVFLCGYIERERERERVREREGEGGRDTICNAHACGCAWIGRWTEWFGLGSHKKKYIYIERERERERT